MYYEMMDDIILVNYRYGCTQILPSDQDQELDSQHIAPGPTGL